MSSSTMNVVGREPSSRLVIGPARFLHHVLYVREALGLHIPVSPVIPPPLSLIPQRHAIDDQTRRAAEVEWPEWWITTVRRESELSALLARSASPDSQSRAEERAILASLRRAENPDGAVLAALVRDMRDAIKTSFATVKRTTMELRPPEMIGAVLQKLTQERGATVGSVSVEVRLVFVDGMWWHQPGPGALICSTAVLFDIKLMSHLLRDVC